MNVSTPRKTNLWFPHLQKMKSCLRQIICKERLGGSCASASSCSFAIHICCFAPFTSSLIITSFPLLVIAAPCVSCAAVASQRPAGVCSGHVIRLVCREECLFSCSSLMVQSLQTHLLQSSGSMTKHSNALISRNEQQGAFSV